MHQVSPEFSPEKMNLSPSLKVLECAIYRGPHLYSAIPMIRIQVDLGPLEAWPTNRLEGFSEKLLQYLPNLSLHGCSSGEPGGFLSRLKEGTWLGHVIEHVALELQSVAGKSITRGKTRSVKGKPGHYNIMYAYAFEEVGLCAGRVAMDLVASLLPKEFQHFENVEEIYDFPEGESIGIGKGIAFIKRLNDNSRLGPTTQSLVDEAERRGIPWQRLDHQSLILLGNGRHQKIMRASITANTPHIAVETASDKELTKRLLADVAVPVPKGAVVRTAEDAIKAAKRIGFPVVTKPLNANQGKGVSTDLLTEDAVSEGFAIAQGYGSKVIIEKFYPGRDYRALVVAGELVAVSQRMPAHVIGNGTDTIAQLIEIVNADPRRGGGHENAMTRIKADDTVKLWIARSELTFESVPASGQHVVLAATANLSTGGTAIDRTDEIHPDNASIARRAALAIGLDVAGIDMVLPDITQSWEETGGGIVEVNAAPGFRMHVHPAQGQPRDVAKPVMASLFPTSSKTRIPVIAITGTNGKSTTVRMVAHILEQAGMRVGFTSTSGIYVNNECIWHGDASGPKSARIVLRNPTIDVAVLEAARGGILREGLGVAYCDVGAVLNVTPDHLGKGGINTLQDLAAVKSVVTESVYRRGVSVLNADDPETLALTRHAGGSICYFSMQPADNIALQDHLKKGKRGVIRQSVNGKEHIVLHFEGARTPVISIDAIPAASFGAATFNIENALAATAIAWGLDISPHIIRNALSSFTSSYEQNPGRFNMYDGHGFRVIMDYAHNAAGFHAFFGLIRQMRKNYRRVIGHVNTPGDRRDEDIREVGRIAARELDLVVFRELPDNRGRPAGEVIGLLAEGARSVGCSEDRIICVRAEEDATDICLQHARPGDIVILTPTKIDATWKRMLAFKPAFTQQEGSSAKEDTIHA